MNLDPNLKLTDENSFCHFTLALLYLLKYTYEAVQKLKFQMLALYLSDFSLVTKTSAFNLYRSQFTLAV